MIRKVRGIDEVGSRLDWKESNEWTKRNIEESERTCEARGWRVSLDRRCVEVGGDCEVR